MTELFGIPVGSLLVVLLIGLGAAVGAIGFLALRNPILVKLGVRNVGRRGSRTALIVLGLMLGTAIIAAALTTGDTMSHTIRRSAIKALGTTDEVVAARGATQDLQGELGQATGVGYFPESVVDRIDAATRPTGLVDGVTGVVLQQVAVRAPTRRQAEPSVMLFAPDPARMQGFAPIEKTSGDRVSLSALRPGQVYLNAKAADELGVRQGDPLLVFTGREHARVRIRDVVRFDGAVTANSAVLMPLGDAQQLLGRQGQVVAVFVSNRGGELGGVGLSDQVAGTLRHALLGTPLEVSTMKKDVIEDADVAGNAFMAFFTTFGSFSIAAGILLIFLIFVMLAAERRGELGIARAIGTRRSHLVEIFLFEGAAYDLAAAVVGALLGAVIAYGMVLAMAKAFGATDADTGLQIEYAVTFRSLALAFSIGVLLTLAVVAFSAWRVSTMTISSAIRNLPEPSNPRRRRRLALGVGGVALGVLMIVGGGDQATPILMGVSLVVLSLVPILGRLGVSHRVAFTGCGITLVVFLLLPWRAWESVFGPLSMNFSVWIASGLVIVVGAVWVIVFNADLLIGLVSRTLGRIRSLAPILRISMAYPLTSRFRTGTTLAMFTLVVFTLVTGSTSSSSFLHAAEDVNTYGGGFDITAGTSGTATVSDMKSALEYAPGIRAADYPVVASQSVLGVDARQAGSGRPAGDYVARGLDDAFLENTTFGLGAVAKGYSSSRDVWNALREHPGLAVVDSSIVPRRQNFNFSVAPSDFRLTGFVYEEGSFAPVPIVVRDPQTSRSVHLRVIGVLTDTAPLEMYGILTSQATLSRAFPGRVVPTIHYFAVAHEVDPDAAAARLESAFLANGLEANSVRQTVADATAASVTFNRLIQGFIGLGLIVGVAALGVISARSVVERRQQIGVLRAIGFRRGMVQATFLLESTFVAVTAIVIGTVLGLILAYNIIDDQRRQPSWSGLTLVVPWLNLALIFLVVYAVAIAATLVPALRASRIQPAEALRYE